MVQFKDLVESNVKSIFLESLLDEKEKKKTNDGADKDDDKKSKKSDKADNKKKDKKDDKKDKDSSKDSKKDIELNPESDFKDNVKLLTISAIHPALGLSFMGLKKIGLDPIDGLTDLLMSEDTELDETLKENKPEIVPYKHTDLDFDEWVKNHYGPSVEAFKTSTENADLFDIDGEPFMLQVMPKKDELLINQKTKKIGESKENNMKQESMIDTIIRNVLTEGRAGLRRYPDTGITAADILNVLHHQYKLIGLHVDESQDLETKKKIFIVSGLNDLDKDLPKTLKVDFVELKLLPEDEASKMNAGMATSNHIYVIDKLDDEYPLENERI